MYKQGLFGNKWSNKTPEFYANKLKLLGNYLASQNAVSIQDLEKTQRMYNDIVKEFKELSKSLTLLTNDKEINALNANVEKFNQLLVELNLAKVATTLAQGDFFENTVAAAALIIND